MLHRSEELALRGWYVISLRPQNLHGGVRSAARGLGANTFALSTQALRPLDAGESLALAMSCPRVVVTSPAAVRFAHAQRALVARRGQTWHALGPGSAAALRRCGIEQVVVSARGADSEALLEDPAFAGIRGERVGLITAPGGRGLIATTLAERGATLVVAQVYQRQALALSMARLKKLDALPVRSALLLTSSEALAPLWAALDAAGRCRLAARPCVVASDRLQAQAHELGFPVVVRAALPTPSALLAALAAHVGQARFR